MRPTEIKVRKKARCVEVTFDDGAQFSLPFEYLRVFSPSAEVSGHAPGQGLLLIGKENVQIIRTEPIGTYAVKFVFDDGHDSGIYTWRILYNLGEDYDKNWAGYLEKAQKYRH